MIRPARASNRDSPITVARQHVLRHYNSATGAGAMTACDVHWKQSSRRGILSFSTLNFRLLSSFIILQSYKVWHLFAWKSRPTKNSGANTLCPQSPTPIKIRQSAHSVGFISAEQFSASDQISVPCIHCYSHIRELHCIHPCLDFKSYTTIDTSIVHSNFITVTHYNTVFQNFEKSISTKFGILLIVL